MKTVMEEGGGEEGRTMLRELGMLIKSELKPWKPGGTTRPCRGTASVVWLERMSQGVGDLSECRAKRAPSHLTCWVSLPWGVLGVTIPRVDVCKRV